MIGNLGSIAELGAIALGALVFSFVYWTFGFLRMGTTGFTAQASGAGDQPEVRATLARALLFAVGMGILLIALQLPIAWVALRLLGATSEVETLTRAYFDIRIWGAPATLATFAVLGSLVGLGKTRHVLATQVVLNGLNIGLDVLFAAVLGMGVEGIALGTVLAEWSTLIFGLLLVRGLLRDDHNDAEPFWPWPQILDVSKVRAAVSANADIMVRTLFLLSGFAWFTNQGARFGDEVLAANHVLLQLVTMSAYLLDGYAHATEVLVGRAVGAGMRRVFDQTVRSATELAIATALVLSAAIVLAGPWAVATLTDHAEVRAVALTYLPYAAIYVACSFAAFQLDGIFIGATGTRDMRNASILSFVAFLAFSLLLVPALGNLGLWIAFIGYVIARAGSLAAKYAGLRDRVVA